MSKLSGALLHRKEVAKERMLICMECDKYIPSTTQCDECKCVMLIKTILASSVCPLGKWGSDLTPKEE